MEIHPQMMSVPFPHSTHPLWDLNTLPTQPQAKASLWHEYSFKKINYLYLYMSLCVHVPVKARVLLPLVGVTGGHDPLDLGAGNELRSSEKAY